MTVIDTIIWVIITNMFIGIPMGIFIAALAHAAGRDRIDD